MTRLLKYSWVEQEPNAYAKSRRHSNEVYSARNNRLAFQLELAAHILVRTVGQSGMSRQNIRLATPPYNQDSNMPRIKMDVLCN